MSDKEGQTAGGASFYELEPTFLSGESLVAGGPAGDTVVPFDVGATLGKYELTAELGKGGMGVVFLATDPFLDRDVAVKVITAEYAADATTLSRFVDEARSAGRLQHPNVVAVYDVGEQDGTHYLVMEYLPGGSLADRLEQGGKVDLREATEAAADAAAGLAAAHAIGLVHRDVKPENLMVGADGVVKVADFGLAKRFAADGLSVDRTAAGKVLGTPSFMSPEQCRGEAIDGRSDLYSLGATYFALLTGRGPYAGAGGAVDMIVAHTTEPVPDLRNIDPSLPSAAARVIKKAMEKSPAERYPDAFAMAADLAAVAEAVGKDGAMDEVHYRGTVSRPIDSLVLPSERQGSGTFKYRGSVTATPAGGMPAVPAAPRRGPSGVRSPSSAGRIQPTDPATPERLPVTVETSFAAAATVATETPDARLPSAPADADSRRESCSLAGGGVDLFWPRELTESDLETLDEWWAFVRRKMEREATAGPDAG